jgi:hypothetical protein
MQLAGCTGFTVEASGMVCYVQTRLCSLVDVHELLPFNIGASMYLTMAETPA